MTEGRTVTEDPRIAATRMAVRRAALAEFAARGHGGFAIEGVAKRSGVAKSTIYRHWPGAPALLADALAASSPQPVPDMVPGTAWDRARVLLVHLAEAMTDPDRSGALPALVEAAEHDPTLADIHHRNSHRRMATLVDVLADGVAAGDLPDDVDPEVAALCLAGAVIYRRLMTPDPTARDEIERLLAQVLGPAPTSGRATPPRP